MITPTIEERQQMLADWRALCEWLEAQAYNASYYPGSRGAYLLTGPCPADRTIRVDDPDAPPLLLGTHHIVYRKKEIPNPNLKEEQERARRCRMIVRERQRLGVVFWSTGHGWRLRKDYRERLEREQQRLDEVKV